MVAMNAKQRRASLFLDMPDARKEMRLSNMRKPSPFRKRVGFRVGWALICLAITTASFPSGAAETKVYHTVAKGESVAEICDFYGVAQRDFLELNGLKKGKTLKVGVQVKIPNVLRTSGKRHTVQEGDTLASIGEKYKRPPKEIAAANKLQLDTPLSPGRTLVIPDDTSSSKKIKVDRDGPSSILFLRIKTGERERLMLYSKSGEVIYKSVQTLSYLARDINGEQTVKRLHYNLVKMIQAVGEKFEGKPIEIISGYRPQSSGAESQHAFGRAMDFRIPGVAPKTVYNFCRTLKHAGCGYYPNAGFVHMDTRTQSAAWIDRSSSKQAAAQ